MATRHLFVRLPAGVEPRHLHEAPGIWLRVQNSHLALELFDKLEIVAFDQSWKYSRP
jgi:hypothetical protein